MEIVVMMTSTDAHPVWLINALLDSNHIQQPRFSPQNDPFARYHRSAIITVGQYEESQHLLTALLD